MRLFVTILTSVLILEVCSKTYYLHNRKKVNWYIAFQDCLTRGQQLATINNVKEQNELEDLMSENYVKHRKMWISGTDSAQEGQYVWMSTGEIITYFKWVHGEPNNTNKSENCLEVVVADDPRDTRWNDNNCFSNQFYICEDKLDF